MKHSRLNIHACGLASSFLYPPPDSCYVTVTYYVPDLKFWDCKHRRTSSSKCVTHVARKVVAKTVCVLIGYLLALFFFLFLGLLSIDFNGL